MVNTSARPITVDSVRLDTLAWNISKIGRAVAGRRSANQQVPGRDGVIPSLNDDLEPVTFGLEMFVMGTDADGAVPAAGRADTFRANLDELIHLFGKRHALLEVTEQVTSEKDATNLALNPSWEGATTYTTSSAGLTTSIVAVPDADTGANVLRSEVTGAPPATPTIFLTHGAANRVPAAPGQAIGVRYKIRTPVGGAKSLRGRLRCYLGNAFVADVGEVLFTPSTTSAWTTITASGVLPAGCDGFGLLVQGLTVGEWATGHRAEIDSLVLWAVNDPGAYFSGDNASDQFYNYAWTGAAHNSTSTRIARTKRRAFAKVVDSIQPDVNAVGSSGMFTVGLELPYGVWEDALVSDYTDTNYTNREVTPLRGATERIADGIYLVEGPVTNPRLEDAQTGAYVELQRTLAAGEFWRLNAATWASRYGNGLTLNSADTAGTDGIAQTRWGGMVNQAGFLCLTPIRTGPGVREIRMTLGGTGRVAGTTKWSVRARRKYAA